jgi:CheY-like chemotaxis protein
MSHAAPALASGQNANVDRFLATGKMTLDAGGHQEAAVVAEDVGARVDRDAVDSGRLAAGALSLAAGARAADAAGAARARGGARRAAGAGRGPGRLRFDAATGDEGEGSEDETGEKSVRRASVSARSSSARASSVRPSAWRTTPRFDSTAASIRGLDARRDHLDGERHAVERLDEGAHRLGVVARIARGAGGTESASEGGRNERRCGRDLMRSRVCHGAGIGSVLTSGSGFRSLSLSRDIRLFTLARILEHEVGRATEHADPAIPRQTFMKTKSVLIIDDEEGIRETLQLALEFEGYDVHTAANGEEGLEVLDQIRRPCLILLDLMMPVMNGWEFAVALAKSELHKSIPVVVVSAFDTQAQGLPVRGVLKKPIDLSTLFDTVRQWCA